MKRSLSKVTPFAYAIAICGLAACNINDSWEVRGGGYFKYQINDGESYKIELGPDDVEVPYIRNNYHYFLAKTRIEESERGDVFSIMVDRPILGENSPDPSHTWMQAENTTRAYLTGSGNIIRFDRKDDTTWTANVDLHFTDCRTGKCNTDLPPLHITGWLHYWIPEDYR